MILIQSNTFDMVYIPINIFEVLLCMWFSMVSDNVVRCPPSGYMPNKPPPGVGRGQTPLGGRYSPGMDYGPPNTAYNRPTRWQQSPK